MRAYVLVVEKDLTLREIIIALLEELGHTVLGVKSMPKGLSVMRVLGFDAVIMSPGALTLGEASYAIEAKDLQPNIKIIMAAMTLSSEYFQSPFDAFLQKPFTLKSLEKALETAFQSSTGD